MDHHSRYNPKPDNARQVALRKVAVIVGTLLTDSDTERPADDGLTCGALREAITLLGGLLPVTPRRVGMAPELGMGYGAGNEGGQPSPYSTALTRVAFDDATKKAKIDFEAIDTARAFDELEAWIAKSPGTRACWTIDRMGGKWRVGLSCGDERFSASQDAELRGAIRNALMIAKFAGCL